MQCNSLCCYRLTSVLILLCLLCVQGDNTTCMSSKICTSKCRCYDGVTVTTNDNTKQVFDRNDVDAQGILIL